MISRATHQVVRANIAPIYIAVLTRGDETLGVGEIIFPFWSIRGGAKFFEDSAGFESKLVVLLFHQYRTNVLTKRSSMVVPHCWPNN